MDILLLRFDAPLMSFGGPMIDNRGVIQDYPPLSLLTGLMGNALGWDHRDRDRLQRLQGRIRFAARRDRAGVRITDFQTVDLGQDSLVERGWTTRGSVERRGGGSARESTHIRYREYLADAVYTLAVTLTGEDEKPTVNDIAVALDEPERPLFVGRKHCLPAVGILAGRVRAASLRDALRDVPPAPRADPAAAVPAWWDDDGTEEANTIPVSVCDERDWTNQIHGGERRLRHGMVELREVDDVR